MHAERLLHKWLADVLSNVHPKRLGALGAVIAGALRGGKLTVTGIGRAIPSFAKEKHNIKRADRLLSNRHLQDERIAIYTAIAQQLIKGTKRPIILVDWSDVDARREFFLLRAATPVGGRSLTIYEEVHGWSTKEKRSAHNKFLRKLKEILPQGCRPIIVTDAGFQTPWFKQVRALGWDFVGRVRGRDKVQLLGNASWIGGKSLYSQARAKPLLLEKALLTRSKALPCALVLYKSKPKGRVLLGKMGKEKRDRLSLVAAARAREPWLLTTSLSVKPEETVKIYSSRMQIEEAFRDLKCPRYGLSLYLNGTYKINRLAVLVLIGSLAATFVWLLGKATQLARRHRQFQANTVSSTSVLSAVFLGIRVFRNCRFCFSVDLFRKAARQLNLLIETFSVAL